jgi:hypothetical protein
MKSLLDDVGEIVVDPDVGGKVVALSVRRIVPKLVGSSVLVVTISDDIDDGNNVVVMSLVVGNGVSCVIVEDGVGLSLLSVVIPTAGHKLVGGTLITD